MRDAPARSRWTAFVAAGLKAGTYVVAASYSGDADFVGSSFSVSQQVKRASKKQVEAPLAPLMQGDCVVGRLNQPKRQ